jgi:hypothetical protein
LALAQCKESQASKHTVKNMKQYFSPKLRGWPIAAIVAGILIFSVLVIHFVHVQAAYQPPGAITLSLCQPVPPGAHRISSDFGTRFDVPEALFTVRGTVRDMPGGTLYVVTLRNREENMLIWRDDDIFRELKNAFPVFSERVEEQPIRDRNGQVIGKDRWGYLKSGERWRYVTFLAGDALGYRPYAPEQAHLFDQIISSACISQDSRARPAQ